jgi:hypothetical protein
VDEVLTTLNTHPGRLKFTTEREKNGILPYLDMEIHKIGNKLESKVYRKDTDTGKFLNFASNNPIAHKISVVNSLTKRAMLLCSKKSYYIDELNYIHEQLITNGYTKSFIHKYTFRRNTNSIDNKETSVTHKTVILPWSKGMERISRVMRKHKIRIFYKCNNKLGQILKNQICKKPIKTNEPTNVVYKIPCSKCEATYIGETSRTLKIRKREHQNNLRCCQTKNSRLAEHSLDYDHPPAWDKSSIIYNNIPNWSERTFLESIVSSRETMPLNISRDLPSEYRSLLKGYQRKI